ncbi:hypothetical protein GQ457_15G012270 [Hibiscus cannabinus]
MSLFLDREKSMLAKLISVAEVFRVIPGHTDKFRWIHNKAGKFNVKKFTALLVNVGIEDPNFDFGQIRKLKIPPKVKNFLWMLKIDRFPIKEFLILRDLECEENQSFCVFCESRAESSHHLNNKIFNERSVSNKDLLFNTKWRAMVWIKASKEGLIENIDEWWESPSNCLRMDRSATLLWSHSLIGSVKFNVMSGVQG